MRVLFVARAPFISGAEKSMLLTILALRNYGINVLVLCPKGSPLCLRCKEMQIPVVESPKPTFAMCGDRLVQLNARLCTALLPKKRIDIVHCNQIWNNPLAASIGRILRVPTVCHMRDYVMAEGLRWFLRVTPDGVISVSRHLQSYLQVNGLSACLPIAALPGPVTLPPDDILHKRQSIRNTLSRMLGISCNSLLVLFAGQFTHQKGIIILCEAFEKLRKYRIHGIVLGATSAQWLRLGGHWKRRLLELVRGRRITVLPCVDDLSPFYASADIAVMPSLEEPLGRIALEAATFGVPSIVAKTDGLAETVIPHVTGWVIPPGDSCALAEAIRQACDCPLTEYGQRARQLVRRLYSAEAYVSRLLEFYKSVISSSNAQNYL